MRVVSGGARGRKLMPPSGNVNIRPTADRVKEAIFDIIQFEVEGRKVLDLFSGSGQMGIEALSRGASSVTFVDENSESVKLIRQNIERCKGSMTDPVFLVQQSDAIHFLKYSDSFDIILMDPPFNSNLMKKALDFIITVDKLNFGGIIICESSYPQEDREGYSRKLYKYGKTHVTVYRRQ